MTRQIPAGSMIITPDDARILYQVASIAELRNRHRVGDTRVYRLLNDITLTAFTDSAGTGNEPRQTAAREEREYWTTEELAAATGIAPRTIRLACETGDIPATKTSGRWVITADEATTYLNAKRR